MVLSSQCVKDQKKVDIILQMLDDFVADEEYSMMIRHGFEGEDYILGEDGSVLSLIHILPYTPAHPWKHWYKPAPENC